MGELRNHPRWMGASHAATNGSCAVLLGALLAAPLAAHASATRTASRFALSGTATLKASATVQTGGALQLRAAFAASADNSAVAGGGGYMLTARIASTPLVCTSDTIFEDGFDG